MAQQPWYKLIQERHCDLRSDKFHPSFNYRDGYDFTKATTRQQIVEFYEQAYAELAESVHGQLERIVELEGDVRTHKQSLDDLIQRKRDLEHRLGQTGRRLWGLLSMIEQQFYDEFQEPKGYFSEEEMYDDYKG